MYTPGRSVSLILKDDGYEPKQTIKFTNELKDKESVFALFSFVGTPTSKQAVPIAREAKIPFISPFTGAEFLRNSRVNPHVVNLRASYYDETRALVDLFVSQNKKKISVFKQYDSYGAAGEKGVSKALKNHKLKIHSIGKYKRNTVDVAEGVSEIAKTKPDAIIMIGAYKPCAKAIKAFRNNPDTKNADLANISFVGTESLISESGLEGEGVYISQVLPSPKFGESAIVKKYQKAVKNLGADLSYTSFEGYLNAAAMAEALKNAGPKLDRQKFLKAYESLNIDLGGLFLKFDQKKRQAITKVFITKVEKGEAMPFKEVEVN